MKVESHEPFGLVLNDRLKKAAFEVPIFKTC